VLTIENLMQKKEKFDYVFIEPSGLADPGTGPLVLQSTVVQQSHGAALSLSLTHTHGFHVLR
jgi:G3E family GTPase